MSYMYEDLEVCSEIEIYTNASHKKQTIHLVCLQIKVTIAI